MIELILIACVSNLVQGYLSPLLYAAPSAVSHQSRIDIKHTPLISAPVFFSPAVVATQPAQTIMTPIIASDTLLTPIALSSFHNLPLTRSLEHPIPIWKVLNGANKQERQPTKNILTQKLNEGIITLPDVNIERKDREAEAVVLDVVSENAIKGNKKYISASNTGVQSQ